MYKVGEWYDEKQKEKDEGGSREEGGMGSKGDKANSIQNQWQKPSQNPDQSQRIGSREQMPKRIVNPIGRFSKTWGCSCRRIPLAWVPIELRCIFSSM